MTDDASQIWIIVETETTQTIGEVRRGGRSSEEVAGDFEQQVTEQVRTTIKQRRDSLDAVALKAQLNRLLNILGDGV